MRHVAIQQTTEPDAGRRRVVIERVEPEIDGGRFPVKRVVGERVVVRADLFADGHDAVAARLLYRGPGQEGWQEAPMRFVDNDRWAGEFVVDEPGVYHYTLEAWVDPFATWQRDLEKRVGAGQRDLAVELLAGAELVEAAARRAAGDDRRRLSAFARDIRAAGEPGDALAAGLDGGLAALMARYPERRFATRYDRELAVVVDRERARFSAWYERFPRSCAPDPGRHGTLKDLERLLPEIARMGFDVLYLPPIHPIGKVNRKGRNNAPVAAPGDPGSPWAIGSDEGGHTAIDPRLGTLADFASLLSAARRHGIELALDLAFQCAPDHPWVKAHPEWFRWRPDGTVQYAENPPKKYQDIYPLNFECEEWRALWEELKRVVLFWVSQGVRIFRVDNPHTKPFAFWEWLIAEIKGEHPDVIFLSEAFTRPKVMYRLAKLGFTQSYTYFTWRSTKRELIDYVTELTRTELREYFRPNLWPNTPDILPEHLQFGGRPACIARLVLAATLSSNYGIYGPPLELCVTEALPGREEYRDSEKYEIRHWDWDAPGNLRDLIARLNRVRRENPALQSTWNVSFHEIDNEQLLFYVRATEDRSNVLLVFVNLDPFHTQSGWARVPVAELGLMPDEPYLVDDLLRGEKYIWQGERNYVELSPHVLPAHVFRLRRRLRRETDFDYFM